MLVERVEPRLGLGRATILCEYPVAEAALARPKPGDPRVAERFELYACGVELANGFGELTDPVEQRRRFEAEMALKQRLYGERYPLDEDFLAALALMPPASGMALGFDRLVMLATGAPTIEHVLWAPVAAQRQPRARVTASAKRSRHAAASGLRGSNTVRPASGCASVTPMPAAARAAQPNAVSSSKPRPDHGAAGGVGQELGEVGAAREPAVDRQLLGQADPLAHRRDHLGGAQRDALEQRLAQVALAGARRSCRATRPAALRSQCGQARPDRAGTKASPRLDRRRRRERVQLGRGP